MSSYVELQFSLYGGVLIGPKLSFDYHTLRHRRAAYMDPRESLPTEPVRRPDPEMSGNHGHGTCCAQNVRVKWVRIKLMFVRGMDIFLLQAESAYLLRYGEQSRP